MKKVEDMATMQGVREEFASNALSSEKVSLGSMRAVYPVPLVVMGVNDSELGINFVNITHIGMVGQTKMMLSLKKIRHSAKGLGIGSHLSLNVIDAALLDRADYVGMVSGEKVDKSSAFKYTIHPLTGAPLIDAAKVAMACEIVDDYETKIHHQYIVIVNETIADKDIVTSEGTIDYDRFKPILFDNENWIYLSMDRVLGTCGTFGKKILKDGKK